MSETFGCLSAAAYDALYNDKDYAGECDLIEVLCKEHAAGVVRSVLDLGCGTGTHAITLAARGYDVVGVDLREHMVNMARRKADQLPSAARPEFREGDVRTLQLGRTFDAALMMFAVLGYQTDNAAVLQTLRTAREHLRPGGVLLGDVWYGPAVLWQRPTQRVKMSPTPSGRILRCSEGELDVRQHTCAVQFHFWVLEDGRLTGESEERHLMRYFFPRELELFLETAGFALVRLGAFPEFHLPPDESTWNVLCVARAR